jgi:hypothetical protein
MRHGSEIRFSYAFMNVKKPNRFIDYTHAKIRSIGDHMGITSSSVPSKTKAPAKKAGAFVFEGTRIRSLGTRSS